MSAVRLPEPAGLQSGLDTVEAVLKARADLRLTVALMRTAGDFERAAALAAQVAHLTTIAGETLLQLSSLTTPKNGRFHQLSSLLNL